MGSDGRTGRGHKRSVTNAEKTALADPPRAPRKIGLQLYTIRAELEADPEGSLRRVKEAGFDAVEVAPPTENLPSARLARLLRSHGLAVAALHSELPLGDRADAVAEMAREFDCSRLIWHGWPRDSSFDSWDGIHRLAEQYREAHAVALRLGLQFGLHNHWWEFEALAGRFPYRVILERLHPEVFLEIDTYWVRTAGLDPAAVLAELGSRVTMLHVKDGPAKQGEPMRAAGDGVMDFPAILKTAGPSVEWLIVELDECATDIWEAIRRSRDYLRALI